ncbi:MAG: group I intron-associated PD-(D/E)XK endonuclease [Candidatus Sulfotelmatobacter sp.]
MKFWEKFRTVKERGEWVELQFMAEAARRRFGISRPWKSTGPYDVGIEHGANFLRIQVKSTTFRLGRGYWCQFKPNHKTKRDYSLKQIDLFAAYVIPMNVWYLIPASLLLGRSRIKGTMVCPLALPVRRNSYRYESYRESWQLLTKSRWELAKHQGRIF